MQGVILLSHITALGPAPPPGAPAQPPDVASLACPFFVSTPARTYVFSAADDEERATWLAAIELARAGRAAEAAALGAEGEAVWATAAGGGGGALLLPVLGGADLVDATPGGVPLLAHPVPSPPVR